jgi:glutaminyl-tRNA synthetase
LSDKAPPRNFVRQIVDADVAAGLHGGRVVTRFPPEPNGYLHIGHAKSVCLNFGVAAEQPGGACYLRFDDTNPAKESQEYVDAIKEDIRWLGFDWEDRLTHASDYFGALYEFAVRLVERGAAYVDSLSAEEIRAHRGTLTEPGRPSPYRDRSAAENLDLLARMRAGEFEGGAHVLRARIDMASPNLNLRDPVMYRILHQRHQMTEDRWCIYPMYDFAHGQCDALEGVTHSICTLEFEDHRALYDWFLEALEVDSPPRQYEFARLNLNYTVLSKRMLIELVRAGHVAGWDDPRMPTLKGLRRRGYTPASIRAFCDRVGVTKKDSVVDVGVLEGCVREDLDASAPRAMCVLRPLRLVIENYPEDQEEVFEAPNHPADPAMGTRPVAFCREVFIERDDFLEDPPRKFFRLAPGREVRLRYAYLVTCTEVVKNPDTGEIVELRCRYDPDSRGGSSPDGRKVRGTLHWVSARHGREAEIRLYDRLFREPSPASTRTGGAFTDSLNPDSVVVLRDSRIEASVADVPPGTRLQFERQGYFCSDPDSAAAGRPVFNRTVTLRDTWAKIEGRR